MLNRRAVFLDRDGVINHTVVRDQKPYPPANACEVEILPGVVEALKLLKDAGFILIVVSNQPDIARGATSREAVEEINAYLAYRLPLDKLIMCYHDSGDGCHCRKPLPGMLLDGAEEFDINLTSSYMVGDRWRDVDAGIAACCKTFFIDYGYDEKQPDSSTVRVSSLLEAALIILNGGHSEEN